MRHREPATVVTHSHETVKKHHVRISLPNNDLTSSESFVLHMGGSTFEMLPGDFQQFVNCCVLVLKDYQGL